ncbi:MAG: hypothetical protein K6F75_00900 [Butyrivibrio sp.]|nr:hypothetical protein [Butyrivibrio sp.]
MNRLKLAICDKDEIYCHRLDEYFRGNLKLSFDILSFTDLSILCSFEKEDPISLLIISETLFRELKQKFWPMHLKNILVLDEGRGNGMEVSYEGLCEGEIRIVHASKYQEASKIVDSIIDFCVEHPDEFGVASINASVTKGNVIGFFSPIGKCGQTHLAREVAKNLAAKGKTIFLSFESFSSLPYLLGVSGKADMTDLLYYAECERSKISLFLEKIKISRDGVDYILPARTSMQLKDISFEKMKNLLEILTQDAGYEYVVLDMTDYPEGFLDILLMCKTVVTIIKDNQLDSFRQKQYEEILMGSGYEELRSKTKKILLSDMRDRKAFEACVLEVIKGEDH